MRLWAMGAAFCALMVAGCREDTAGAEAATDAGVDAAAQVSGGPIVLGEREPFEAGATAMPHLRAGFWEATLVKGDVTTTASFCIDDAYQERVSAFARALHNPFCGPPTITPRSIDHWVISNQCPVMDVAVVALEGFIEGDFSRRYTMDFTYTTTGGPAPIPPEHSREEGVYRGACPRGVSPGDMVIGGQVIPMDAFLAIGGAVGGAPLPQDQD